MTRGRRASAFAVVAVAVAGLTTACGNHDVTLPGAIALDSSQEHACQGFVAALPSTVAREKTRAVSPSDARGKAYGDPAITVTCGVKVPSSYSPGASCEIVDGVDWYAPDKTYTDQHVDAVITAVGYTPAVQVVVPAQYRPEGAFLALDELSRIVKKYLQPGQRCS